MNVLPLAEFEQAVLLAALQVRHSRPYAIEIRRELEARLGRAVSRGALYRTFERLAAKDLLSWTMEPASPIPERGGHPMRRFAVTSAGVDALRASRATMMRLWENLEEELDRS